LPRYLRGDNMGIRSNAKIMLDANARTARLRRILIIVILATIPFYLLGMVALWVARASVDAKSITPTTNVIYVTATNPATATNELPTKFPTREPTKAKSPTITHTVTMTETTTPIVIPTETFTPAPTITQTPIPVPTDTSVPPTDTPVSPAP
jgi:hypothetical protein